MSGEPALRKPDFFILGAAKSGTTSLWHCLRQHPQIFMPAVKEPTLFCDDFHVVDNVADYLELFRDGAGRARAGEASHAYLTCPRTAPVLKAFFPEARLIIIMRNPADRAHSLWRHMVDHGYEWVTPFERALVEEERRFAAGRVRGGEGQYLWNFFYYRSGLYGEQIERYLRWFDRDRFLFLTLDQWQADAVEVLGRIWRFLGVDEALETRIETKNAAADRPAGSLAAGWMHLLRSRVRPVLLRLGLPEHWGGQVFGRLVSTVGGSVSRSLLSPGTRRLLLERYSADIALTERLTGLDLGEWRT